MRNLEAKYLIIRVDANAIIGSGHMMRCLALAQAWKNAGCDVVFITACENRSLLQRMEVEGYRVYLLGGSHPDPIDWNHTEEILTSYQESWCVLDGYHFDCEYQRKIKETGHKLLVIDDIAHLSRYFADIIVNQNLYAEQIEYPCEPYTRLLLGTRYVLLRREFLPWRTWQKKIPKIAGRVLITFGGSDQQNLTLKAIRALQMLEIPGLEATAAIGPYNPHISQIEAAIRNSSIKVRLIVNAINMPELMAWSDIAISSAGATTWELLFLGVPSLFFAVAGNQQGIAEEIELREVGRVLREGNDIPVKLLAESIASLAHDFGFRARVNRNARQLVDGKGATRILRAFEESRPFRKGDAERKKSQNSTSERKERFKAVFLGGKQAGCIGLLTMISAGFDIQAVVAYDTEMWKVSTMLHIPTFSSLKEAHLKDLLAQSDVLVCVHGREIVPKRLLDLPHFGGINVHPCLYRYRGANPIGRLLEDGCSKASVGVHRLTENIDEGEILVEEFVSIDVNLSIEQVYNILYPTYVSVLLEALNKVVER